MTTQAQLDSLRELVAPLTAGSVTQAQIDAVDAAVASLTVDPIPTAITTIPLNDSLITCDTTQYFSSRYERYQNPLILTAAAISLGFQATNRAAGGATNVSFPFARYGLNVDGVERASYTRVGTERAGRFVGALADEADGLHRFDIVAGGTLVMTHWGYIDRTGKAKDDPNTVAQTASRDWELLADASLPVTYQFAVMPKTAAATRRVKPLTARLGVPFSTTAAKLTKVPYAIGGSGAPPRSPCVTRAGITVTENRQPYFWSDLIMSRPVLPMLDGPRGTCTTPFTTDLRFGRNGKLYGAGPFQAWVMDATGAKKTLYGLRHKYAPLWSETSVTGPEVEVVGNWDATIPVAERFAWESWGMCWDQRSLAINPAAPPPPGETEHPHVSGPTHFRSDRHGYVIKVVSSPISHTTPPTITRFFVANDPWGMDGDGTTIYVAERGFNRISRYSMDTGAYLGALIEDNAAPGMIDQANRIWAGANAAACRALPIVAPEGVAILDGYLYWGSFAQAEVRRIPLAGGPVEVVCRPLIDNNSKYVYIAISDGSFGPRGTVFVTTWSVGTYGRPQAFVPGSGTASDGTVLTHAKQWNWQGYASGVIQGPGGLWETAGYASAVAVGRKGSSPDDPDYGALASSSSDGDVSVFMQAQAIDGPAPTATDYASIKRGVNVYRRDHVVLHGAWCAGPDLPLPWGADPDCDKFMRTCGMMPT